LGLALLTLSACAEIIGISGYEIDETLDGEAGRSGSGGDEPSGGKSPGGSSSVMAGAATIDGGEAGAGSTTGGVAGTAGSEPAGGQSTGGAPPEAGQPGAAGDAGDGGQGPIGCQSAAECDDSIDCTDDACLPNGTCRHTADDSACDPFKCQSCQAGVGCVAGPTTMVDLLTDPGFDGTHDDWVEASDYFNDQNIFPNAMAQTAPNIATFGPAVAGAEEQEYADLLQYVEVPEGTVGITLTGYYKLAPGGVLPDEDYAVAAFYDLGAIDPIVQFHSWTGDGTAKAAWTSFTYNAPKAKLLEMSGNEYTFDLVAYSWETVFSFDSLKLTATVCQ
jgi:hypothetical protein